MQSKWLLTKPLFERISDASIEGSFLIRTKLNKTASASASGCKCSSHVVDTGANPDLGFCQKTIRLRNNWHGSFVPVIGS